MYHSSGDLLVGKEGGGVTRDAVNFHKNRESICNQAALVYPSSQQVFLVLILCRQKGAVESNPLYYTVGKSSRNKSTQRIFALTPFIREHVSHNTERAP